MSRLELVGRRFGRLEVIRSDGIRKRDAVHSDTAWLCRCSCGTEKTVIGNSLTSGHTTSCGCVKIERTAAMGRAAKTHGMSFSPEYYAWGAMLRRCMNANSSQWPAYGGRGLRVCERWQQSFAAFLEDMGPRPKGHHGKLAKYSIERTNNSLGYEPKNCRWATMREQCANRRSNRHITAWGITKTLSQWCDEAGLGLPCVRQRILKGMTPEEALSKPSARTGLGGQG